MTNDAPSGAVADAPEPPTDETFEIRHKAAQHLLGYLERIDAMLARCESAMRDKSNDQFTAANTAVRLMTVGGELTRSLMLATFGETRHRSLTDNGLPLPPPPSLAPPPPSPVTEDIDATKAVLAHQLRIITEECAREWDQARATEAYWTRTIATHKEQQAALHASPQE
jgi:hypothetical protein